MADPQPPQPAAVLAWLSALSDLARVRLLAALEEAGELTVGELASALQLPQSTVSRHLKLLTEQGWVRRRTAGTASLYAGDVARLPDAAQRLWAVTSEQFERSPTFADDRARLREILAARQTDSRDFFGRIGADWAALRTELFGEAFTAEALLRLIPADLTVADLGCGTGDVSAALAPVVRRVIAVDREPAMLDAARRRLERAANVEFRAGDLMGLPLADGEVGAAVTMLVLHHVHQPADAVVEIARVLAPGGVLLIVDMVRHDREVYRQTMGHEHLGFDEPTVRQWAERARLRPERYTRLRPDTARKGPGLFVARLSKPGGA